MKDIVLIYRINFEKEGISMESFLSICKITCIKKDTYSWNISTDKYQIVVWNPFFYVDIDGNIFRMTDDIAKTMTNIETNVDIIENEWVIFRLNNGDSLKISIRDKDYTGPEALYAFSVNKKGSHIVI
jgi:hypothetical protein